MIKCGRLAAPVKIGGGGCVGLTVAGIGVIYSFGVVVGGMGVKVGMGVLVGAGVVADAQAANTTAKKAMNIIIFIFTPLSVWFEVSEGLYCIMSHLWFGV